MSTAASTSPGRSMRAGAAAIAPIALSVVPFGIIAGFATVDIGLGVAEALGFSLGIFAGASQLAAIELLGQGASVAVVVTTVVVINLRVAMYSASLAPHLAAEPTHRRVLGAYLLTDQAFAVSITRFLRRGEEEPHRFAFYLGAALPMWLVWQPSTVAGALVGDQVPEGIPIGFAVPLAFLALLMPAITDRPALAAALVGGGVATVGAGWPANLGMPLGALAGVAVGFLLARRAAATRLRRADAGGAGGVSGADVPGAGGDAERHARPDDGEGRRWS